MSFDTLQSAILGEAKAEASRISEDLEKQRKDHETRIKNLAAMIEEKIITQANKEAEQKERRLQQEAEFIGRSHVLRAKQQELDTTREAFLQELLKLPEEQAEHFITALFTVVPKNLKGEVIAGEHHAALVKKVAKKHGVTVASDTLHGRGGFIVRTSESEINLTTDHLVKQLFARHRAELAKALFS